MEDFFSWLWPNEAETTIAVTGLRESGKTSFLTSLFWQLHEPGRADFHLANNVKITNFRELRSVSTFPFERFRNVMASNGGSWPRKTTEDHHYLCSFNRSDQPGTTQHVKFLDFPGERIADAGIALHPDYAHWCSHMFDTFVGDSSKRPIVAAFVRELEGIFAATGRHGQNESHNRDHRVHQVVRSYYRLLAHYARDWRLGLSPSTFWLSRAGEMAEEADPDVLADIQLSRSDVSSQFAPLPPHLFDKNFRLVATMQDRYRNYRNALVVPTFKQFAEAQAVVILVDIFSLLVGGVNRYNDNRQVLLSIFEYLSGQSNQSDDGIFANILEMLGLWSPAVQRVALVATKADLARQSDLEKGRVKSLLRSMTARVQDLFPNGEVRWFDCSACISTRQVDDDMVQAVPRDDNPQRSWEEYPVSPLPDDWPDDWKPEDYQFPEVFPHCPANLQVPPKHRNLDAVFDFVALNHSSGRSGGFRGGDMDGWFGAIVV